MRVLFLTEYYPGPGETFTGGVETRVWHVATGLAERHDVTVLTSRQPGQPRLVRQGRLQIRRVGPQYPYSNEGHVVARFCWAVVAFLNALRVDAELVDGTSFLTYIPAAAAGLVKRIPRVATYHESWVGGRWIRIKGWLTGGLGETWERIALRLPWTRIISVSGFTKRALVRSGVSDRLVTVIPNGIDLSQSPVEVTKEEHPTIACVSRLIGTKRVDVLLRAIPLIAKRVPDIRVELVGAGVEETSLRDLAHDLGVSESVTFRGRVESNEEVRRTIARAHVFALPSEMEGFGIVVLEAMAARVPVVCSDIEPLREVTAGRGALLFRPGDHEDLAEKASALLTNVELYSQAQADAVRRASEFAWSEIVPRIEVVYREVTGTS